MNKLFHVYCLTEDKALAGGPCKVGVATNLSKRLSALQGGNWRQLYIAWHEILPVRYDALNVEQIVLMRLRPSIYGNPGHVRRLKSEWLDATPQQAHLAATPLLEAIREEGI